MPVLAALWAKSGVKWGVAIAALLAIGGLVVAALRYVDNVRAEGFAAGKAETEVQVITNTVVVKERIQRAEEKGPRTPAAVDQRLRAGTF